MPITIATRRTLLRSLLGAIVLRYLPQRAMGASPLALETLIRDHPAQGEHTQYRRYRADAYVRLFSVPIFSRQNVGGGYAVVEQGTTGKNSIVGLQFAGGSLGNRTHGLNRVGLIQEVVIEQQGSPMQSAYFGFMVSSGEKSLSEARKSIEVGRSETIPYSAASGSGAPGRFTCSMAHLAVPAHYTWTTFDQLDREFPSLIAGAPDTRTFEVRLPTPSSSPTTFLYSMRRAILSGARHTDETIVYNGKHYQLITDKQPDRRMGQQMAARGTTHQPGEIWKLNGTSTVVATREATPFQVWFEHGEASGLPLRIEFYPKSFLKLVFEHHPTDEGPRFSLLLKKS